MLIRRQEALDLLQRWFREDVLLFCELKSSNRILGFGRIIALSDEELTFRFDDVPRGCDVPLDRADFLYDEPRDFPELADKIRESLGIRFISRLAPLERERIVFFEIIPPS